MFGIVFFYILFLSVEGIKRSVCNIIVTSHILYILSCDRIYFISEINRIAHLRDSSKLCKFCKCKRFFIMTGRECQLPVTQIEFMTFKASKKAIYIIENSELILIPLIKLTISVYLASRARSPPIPLLLHYCRFNLHGILK